ncbi:hypothetical protein F511_26566 [Dorcoceras hygrometricum]|uniref:Splicing factor 3B subunit 1-like n=1 Tax=Dorcoceras hygrometricum TaxID=472368 RepID=A0A2Z7C9W6_9LAMI|nr:hypothetical protein F511_26566 [Dorcoceras hygrometricum]
MDNAGMVAMFKALVESGFKGLLGCSSAIFETALVEFFHNASVRDGMVVSTVLGKPIANSEELFASTFALPLEGLTDLHEVPQDFVLEARRAFSHDGKVISTSCKKRELVFEFCLLSDILAKSVTVKAGSFDAVTHERFLMMSAIFRGVKVNWGRLLFNIFKDMVTPGSRKARGYAVHICILLKNVPNLELGDSKEFPPLKVLTEKTVSRYIAINKNIVVEDVDDESRVKKTSMKKAASNKRPATAVDEPVVKKTRARVGKAAVVAKDSALVSVAQKAVPLQVVEPITIEQPPKLKRKSPKRKLKLPQGSEDELVDKDADVGDVEKQSDEPTADVVVKEPAVDTIAEKERVTSGDDVDLIIQQILADTAQFETDVGEPDVGSDTEDVETDQNTEPLKSGDNDETSGFLHPKSDPATYFVKEPIEETEQNQGTDITDMVQTADRTLSDDESMTLEEHLSTIPDGSSLPSSTGEVTKIQFGKSITIRGVDEGDWYKASIPNRY